MAADVLSVIQDVLNQDKQQKREHAKVMREVQKKLKEKEVSEEEGDKEEYTAFVNKTLKKYGVKSPAELSPEDKKRFYDELDAGWKADNEKTEPEDKEEEADLKTRVKDRMEQEKDPDIGELPDDEDDDEPEGGDEGDEDEEGGDEDEPSEEQIDKIADLVVKKLKDKADAEEDEEEEPMKVGGEEEIDTKPKAETHDPRFMGTQLRRSMGEALKQVHENSLDEHCGICGEQGIHEQDEWVDAEAKKVQHKWKRMNTRDRVKWLDKMDTMAGKHNTSDADLEEILDDYGLTKEDVQKEDLDQSADPNADEGIIKRTGKAKPPANDSGAEETEDRRAKSKPDATTKAGKPAGSKGPIGKSQPDAHIDSAEKGVKKGVNEDLDQGKVTPGAFDDSGDDENDGVGVIT